MSRRPTKVEQATTANWGWTTPGHQHTLRKACNQTARHYPAVNPDDLYQDSLLYIAVREQYHHLQGNQWTQMCYRVAQRLANKTTQHLDQPKPLPELIHLADQQTSN
ncbi:helix-turn-helix DNA binding domain protein [Propionibacterium phage Kubed]|uniref:Helix-turn-helix DNA binding domain protein n=1 Tax=Propionibacterium phage Kubed TaxID=1655014 RepID=A0A0H4IRP3_9CAUD|nr:helix-turn-helix DNA binding domain protein [Propionibacterium phage Kubed]AKO60300.1 helix-turn-helix DNA binding domain protein [Propionibacterium phage Kubed]